MTKTLKLCAFIHGTVHGCLKRAVQGGDTIPISRTVQYVTNVEVVTTVGFSRLYKSLRQNRKTGNNSFLVFF